MLLSKFELAVSEKQKHYTLKGKLRKVARYGEHPHSSLYGGKAKLDFMLMYMKENPN
ncbi:MAG: hypothetical protein AAGC85_19270 [Bacteroidota bacterium]